LGTARLDPKQPHHRGEAVLDAVAHLSRQQRATFCASLASQIAP
jgi:hypothetical protein